MPLCAGLLTLASTGAWAIGTDAGASIANTATVNFAVNGSAQTPVSSNTVVTRVDELLDVVVVDDIGGPVAVGSPDADVLLQFSVTNSGNGSEAFRIIADGNVAEGGFDPTVDRLYLETNGLPGLQVGSDTEYVTGISDPVLAEDETLVVYVASTIGAGEAQGANGDVLVRAVPRTAYDQTNVDDPGVAGWPSPGTSYAGLGDGGGAAVVGATHDTGNLLLADTARYQVAAAVVSITKAAVTVLDPFNGTTLVPGSVITYQLNVTVSGTGTVEDLVITDPLPAELEYQPGTLQVAGAAEDDDFAPVGTDESGFNTQTNTVVVDRGAVTGGGPDIVITFEAAIR